MCLTKAIKKFITWKDPLSIFISTSGPTLFAFQDKAKSVLCHRRVRLRRTRWWHRSCGEWGLILRGRHLSGVLWYGGLSNLLGGSSPFSLALFIFSTPPFFPPSPLSPVLKIHMAPTVYSAYTAPLLLLSSSSLLILPSTFSPHPLPNHPPPPHISEFPLIRILRVNPPNSSFHSGLTFSPLAKRTIGWEGQNKRPPCCWCAVLDPRACFLSFSLSLSFSFFPLAETDGCSSSPSPLPLNAASPLPPSCAFSRRPELSFLITRYAIRAHMPFCPLMDLFSINKFLSLAETNAVLQTKLNLNNWY